MALKQGDGVPTRRMPCPGDRARVLPQDEGAPFPSNRVRVPMMGTLSDNRVRMSSFGGPSFPMMQVSLSPIRELSSPAEMELVSS